MVLLLVRKGSKVRITVDGAKKSAWVRDIEIYIRRDNGKIVENVVLYCRVPNIHYLQKKKLSEVEF